MNNTFYTKTVTPNAALPNVEVEVRIDNKLPYTTELHKQVNSVDYLINPQLLDLCRKALTKYPRLKFVAKMMRDTYTVENRSSSLTVVDAVTGEELGHVVWGYAHGGYKYRVSGSRVEADTRRGERSTGKISIALAHIGKYMQASSPTRLLSRSIAELHNTALRDARNKVSRGTWPLESAFTRAIKAALLKDVEAVAALLGSEGNKAREYAANIAEVAQYEELAQGEGHYVRKYKGGSYLYRRNADEAAQVLTADSLPANARAGIAMLDMTDEEVVVIPGVGAKDGVIYFIADPDVGAGA